MDYYPVIPDPADITNQRTGLVKRVARDTPPINKALLKRFAKFVKNWLKKNMPKLNHIMDIEEWLATTSYNEARKQQLRNAHEKLHGGSPPASMTSRIETFGKREGMDPSTDRVSGASNGFKFMRIINSRGDVFKAYSGPLFHQIEELVFANPHFVKRTPVRDRPASVDSLRQAGARYVSTDFTSFEAHFTGDFMASCELLLYKHCLSDFPEVARVIDRVIRARLSNGEQNICTTRQGLKLPLDGRRMSGDMCTSLGNGFANLMMWSFFCSIHGTAWEGYVEGDDGIFAVHSGAIPNAKEYQMLGWTIKIENHNDPSEAGFCGCLYVEGQVVRNPTTVLTSLGWSFQMVDAGIALRKALCRSKMLSLAYELPQCPILGAIARRGVELTEGADQRYVPDGFHVRPKKFDIPKFEPTMAVRLLYERKFGIAPELQVYLEELIVKGKDDALAAVARCLPPPAACVTMGLLYANEGRSGG